MSMTPIELDHGQQNSIEEFQVVFHYSKWTRVDTADENSNSIQSCQVKYP